MLHVDNLKEFQDSQNYSYITFDVSIGTVLMLRKQQRWWSFYTLSQTAKILRRYILTVESNIDGAFNDSCQKRFLPKPLKSFVDHVLQGSNINSSHRHLEQSTLTISQLIVQNCVKRVRNVTSTRKVHQSRSRKSPLGVYLGMLLHATTRKKSLIEKLHKIGISVSYQRVMDLSTSLGNNVLAHYNAANSLCPPQLKSGIFTTAALDNIDHNPSSTTADGSFHGTGISLFQHRTLEAEV